MASNPVVIVKRPRAMWKWVALIHNPELARLHAEGKEDAEIARELGFSEGTLKSKRQRMGLRKNNPKPCVAKTPPCPNHQFPEPDIELLNMPSSRGIFEVAMSALSKRCCVDKGQIWLDGLPSNLNNVIREWNKMRVKQGRPQILNNPAWEVTCPRS